MSFLGLLVGAMACGSTAHSGVTSSGSSSPGGSSGHPGSGTGESTATSTVTSTVTATHSGPGTSSTSLEPANVLQKVDLLFDIDNSASMGDKQAYLIDAIPQMIARLVTPRCVDASGNPTGANASSAGACASGTPEFAPIHDMHIGVVTSSLGPRLGVSTMGPPVSYVCDPNVIVTSQAGTTVSAFNDDQGHLINRTGPFGAGAPLANASLQPDAGGFLYWYPTAGNTLPPTTPPATPYTSIGAGGQPGTLVGDFAELLSGVGESGCGIESQLESWYRFLVQPDPYASLVLNGQQATWSGVDTTILQQRHDFLRPDSVVAIVVLTDENDSEIDVRAFQGSGYLFMSNVYSPPRGTAVCQTNPNDPGCMPCQAGSADPSCAMNGGLYDTSDGNDWGYNLNLRHVHMPQKYGLDAQYPLTRYVNGLTSPMVPNRVGEYPSPTSAYTGTNNCTNPLFASSLPTEADVPDASSMNPSEINTTLCNLPKGSSRTAGDVFFAHIGGVPHQLLQSLPGDGTCPSTTAAADCPQKSSLSAADWVRILGKGPQAYTGGPMSYDYTGIDPHMIEAMNPRNSSGLPNSLPTPASNPAASSLSGPALGTGADPLRPDPINGREWTTNTGVHSLPVDREYACIFQLPASNQRDCAALQATTIEGNSCECVPGGQWNVGGAAAATGNSPDEISPLCSKTSTDGALSSAVGDYTVQTYAKAYPTIRELMVANMMGSQGVISSLCPIHTTDNAQGNDPVYGYRPAMDAIVNRMKNGLPK